MAGTSLVQTRIDPAVKARAARVLENMGLSISDAVRILLTRTANEGALPFHLGHQTAEYDAWFRSKVQEALADTRPALSHEDVEAHFARRRDAALQQVAKDKM